jgi:hypothetical protein
MADLKEKANNLKLILQNDRRVWALIGFVLIVGLLVSMSSKPKGVRTYRAGGLTQPSKPISEEREAYHDLIVSLKQQSKSQQETIEKLGESLQRFESEYKNDQRQVQGIFESMVDKMESIDRDLESLEAKAEDFEAQKMPGMDQSIDMDLGEDSPRPFGFEEATVQPPPPEPPRPTKMTFISPGDSVKVKLLTGVNAPVDGTPYPVVFQLLSPINGPDGSALDLGEARIIAAAQGSEADGRVLFRLADLAIRHKDGRRSVVKVDGWVVGEDGIRGMRGRLIDKLGRLIAATAGVSFMGALGDRIDEKEGAIIIDNSDGVTLDNNDFEASTASAFTDASDRLGQVLIERYEKLIPVVEVLSGREVVAVFSSPVEVTIHDDEGDESIYMSALD